MDVFKAHYLIRNFYQATKFLMRELNSLNVLTHPYTGVKCFFCSTAVWYMVSYVVREQANCCLCNSRLTFFERSVSISSNYTQACSIAYNVDICNSYVAVSPCNIAFQWSNSLLNPPNMQPGCRRGWG